MLGHVSAGTLEVAFHIAFELFKAKEELAGLEPGKATDPITIPFTVNGAHFTAELTAVRMANETPQTPAL